eukprot:Tamp_14338.p1 GENE.Tamp_14338~~Tamp_14338.p1  ORF type:complete len:367 (-),score=116.97 Tamp_14338:1-1101(-)
MANVRLYASKMRSDAKMCSLAADLEMFKLEAAPELELAQKTARKANDKTAKYMLLVAELRQENLELRQTLTETENELQQEREFTVDQRFQIRNLQTILAIGKGQVKEKQKELNNVHASFRPQLAQSEEDVERLQAENAELKAKLAACTQSLQLTQEKAGAAEAQTQQMDADLKQQIDQLQHEETLRINLCAQHSHQARAWAAELAQLKGDVRLRDAQISDLRQHIVKGETETRVLSAVRKEMDELKEELERVRYGAGEKEQRAQVLEVELTRLRTTLAHAQGEKASEIERLERQHAVTLARMDLMHKTEMEKLKAKAQDGARVNRMLRMQVESMRTSGHKTLFASNATMPCWEEEASRIQGDQESE